MSAVPAYAPDATLADPVDIILEHIFIALTVEEKVIIASRLEHHLRAARRDEKRAAS